MKFSFPYKRLLILSLIGGLVTGPLLTSCGSGDGQVAGIGGTGITQGEITAFGSIFVNGVEFDTDSSLFEVDGDNTLNQSALSIGMIVTIKGDIDSNGLTGTAESVDYDDKIQGPVANIPSFVAGSGDTRKILTIFNKTVIIDETTTKYDGTTFDGISQNDVVEISGFDTTATEINATFVKKTGDLLLGTSEVELKGKISNLSLINRSFLLSGIEVNYTNVTEIDIAGSDLSNGLFVEVEGILQNPSLILADEIEEEDESFEDGTKISLQGVVADFSNISLDFTVGGQPVNASNASFSPLNTMLENGINVEVEGNIVDGVLVADEVELREGSVEIKAEVTQVHLTNSQIEFQFLTVPGSIFVTTDTQTQFEDETLVATTFSLSQLMPGDFVKVEGIEDGSEIIASQVKRINSAGEDTEIQGSVSAYTEGATITILGLDFTLTGAEEYEPITLPSSIAPGSTIELVDENPADGTIDKVEAE